MKHVEQTGRFVNDITKAWMRCMQSKSGRLALHSLRQKKHESHSNLAWLLFHVQVLTYM